MYSILAASMALTVAAINSVGALGERGPSATEQVRAVIYTRVSTEMQSETSMQEQERRCRQFAEYRGYEVVRTYKDYGKSGTNTNREEYQQMMADIDSWDIVILFKLDRIHRSSHNANLWATELNKKGKNFAALDIDVDTSTAMGMGIFKIMTVLQEMEVALIRERTRFGLAGKKNAGKHTGRPPYGYSSIYKRTEDKNDKGELEINEPEAEVVRRIFDMRREQMSFAEIANSLNADDVPTRREGKVWTPSVIDAIISRREFYEGKNRDTNGTIMEHKWGNIL